MLLSGSEVSRASPARVGLAQKLQPSSSSPPYLNVSGMDSGGSLDLDDARVGVGLDAELAAGFTGVVTDGGRSLRDLHASFTCGATPTLFAATACRGSGLWLVDEPQVDPGPALHVPEALRGARVVVDDDTVAGEAELPGGEPLRIGPDFHTVGRF